jgi:beta-lactam-binding protein with PASTA domain
VGTDETSANTMLYDAGFEIYAQYVYDVAPAGMVIDQDPPGWTEAEPGSYVTITISEGPAPEGAEYG